jgi:hypothetical protein
MVCESRNSLFAGSCACAGERALNGWDLDHSPQIATEQRAGLPIAIGGFCPFRVESERGAFTQILPNFYVFSHRSQV